MEQVINNKLDSQQADLFSKLLTSLNHDQKVWIGGYLSGMNESTNTLLSLLNHGTSPATQSTVSADLPLLKILFGTRSGNAQKIAQKAQQQAISLGLNAVLVSLNDYNPKELKREKHVLIIASTDGEGEPPISTEEFFDFIHSKKAPALKDLKFSVLALGDSSYAHYCKIGRDIDSRLEALGAERFSDRIDCDLDFEEPSVEWIDTSLDKFAEITKSSSSNITVGATLSADAGESTFTKENPFKVPVLDKILLNGRGSSKETHHYEFSTEDSGITYKPGDSLGIYSTNAHELVDRVLDLTKLNDSEKIVVGKTEKSVREALTHNYELSRITPLLIKDFASIAQSKKLDSIIKDPKKLNNYLWGRDVVDLLEEFPVDFTSKSLFSTFRKLQPRLYSIASSQNANPDEVHIAVASVKYNSNDRSHHGVCSTFLSDRIDEDNDLVPLYIDENISFRLPNDASTPIIMIGAGTGVAPYRAFLQERSLVDQPGNSWLFFGDRNYATDFLYQTDWQKLKKSNVLTNIDLAFSRDQKEKSYVQHKLLAQSKELYKWIQEGAHIYVCGDKDHMAKDVKAAIQSIIETEGGFKADKAEEYFKQLRKENRFQEDVY